MVKVALLLVIEIVAFPVICGWWLDICSLALFDATLKDRQARYVTFILYQNYKGIQYSNFKDLFRSRIFHDDHFASWFDKIFEILDLKNCFNVLLM